MKRSTKTILLWLGLFLATVTIYQILVGTRGPADPPFSQLLQDVDDDRVEGVRVELSGPGGAGRFFARLRSGGRLRTTGVLTEGMLGSLHEYGVTVEVRAPEGEGTLSLLLGSWLPMLAMILD